MIKLKCPWDKCASRMWGWNEFLVGAAETQPLSFLSLNLTCCLLIPPGYSYRNSDPVTSPSDSLSHTGICLFSRDNNFIRFRVEQCLAIHRIVLHFVVNPDRNMSKNWPSWENKAFQFLSSSLDPNPIQLLQQQKDKTALVWQQRLYQKSDIYTEGHYVIAESHAGVHTAWAIVRGKWETSDPKIP